MLKLRVTLEVVDEDGDLVDYKGRTQVSKSFHAPGLKTQQDLFEIHDNVDHAREQLNKMYAIIQSIKGLNQ